MEAKDYLGYIAYFMQKIAPLVSKSDMMAFLSKNLGSQMFNSPLVKVRDTARYMYKGYVTQQYTRYGAFHIISKIDSDKIPKYLAETITLNKKYGVYYDTVDNDLSNAAMDAGIKKFSLTEYKSILSEFIEEDVSIKKSKVGKAKVSKAKSKSKVAKGDLNAAKGKSKTSKGKTKVAKSKSPIKSKVKKPKAKSKTKSCSDYTISELKAMAASFKIPGALKMKREDLCESLGL